MRKRSECVVGGLGCRVPSVEISRSRIRSPVCASRIALGDAPIGSQEASGNTQKHSLDLSIIVRSQYLHSVAFGVFESDIVVDHPVRVITRSCRLGEKHPESY
jgi:hypothetical protein